MTKMTKVRFVTASSLSPGQSVVIFPGNTQAHGILKDIQFNSSTRELTLRLENDGITQSHRVREYAQALILVEDTPADPEAEWRVIPASMLAKGDVIRFESNWDINYAHEHAVLNSVRYNSNLETVSLEFVGGKALKVGSNLRIARVAAAASE